MILVSLWKPPAGLLSRERPRMFQIFGGFSRNVLSLEQRNPAGTEDTVQRKQRRLGKTNSLAHLPVREAEVLIPFTIYKHKLSPLLLCLLCHSPSYFLI